MAKKYLIKTYGCQMNYSDTERIASKLDEIGMEEVKKEKDADLIIFNTCSVKQKAEDKVYGQMIKMRKLKKIKPDLLLAITGCMVRESSTRESEKKDKLLNKIKNLDMVFKICDLHLLPELLRESSVGTARELSLRDDSEDGAGLHPAPKRYEPGCNPAPSQNEYADYFKVKPKYASKFQAFVPIMTGCDKFCSYCIVPFSRGREQSRPMEEILKECENLVKNGCKEITLLGQNVNSYGLSPVDFNSGKFNLLERQKLGLRTQLKNPPFVQLLKKVDALKSKGLCRLRYTSSHPYDMSEDLIKAHGELETLCKHIHLPVQSGDNNVIKRMNRHYSIERYIDLIKRIKKTIPNLGLSTDFIVGFPGETEEEFENTYKLMEKIRFNMIYHSKYSPRKGTFAALNLKDDVSNEEKARRWHKLNELLKECSLEKNKTYIGKKVNVLVEKCKNGICSGKTEENIEVFFPGKKELIGEELAIMVNKADKWFLEGENN